MENLTWAGSEVPQFLSLTISPSFSLHISPPILCKAASISTPLSLFRIVPSLRCLRRGSLQQSVKSTKAVRVEHNGASNSCWRHLPPQPSIGPRRILLKVSHVLAEAPRAEMTIRMKLRVCQFVKLSPIHGRLPEGPEGKKLFVCKLTCNPQWERR